MSFVQKGTPSLSQAKIPDRLPLPGLRAERGKDCVGVSGLIKKKTFGFASAGRFIRRDSPFFCALVGIDRTILAFRQFGFASSVVLRSAAVWSASS